jgi:hypothetical protein
MLEWWDGPFQAWYVGCGAPLAGGEQGRAGRANRGAPLSAAPSDPPCLDLTPPAPGIMPPCASG